ncbi:1,4-beta-xylanase [Treponema ruminis]|uniref:Beta-xylanase n=1 Tax=Treponema ruminis TaxID=744515 RepID=A0A7W8G760_9SPIR|nr:endo-1,4-beta-xylanase [Treponema ruminis]MBB5225055.1 endo-1,4-beta-xylanase [Treponema ruminis]QSI00976.1 1,4-beta-xylanase [Treponema ruminis]
MKKVATLFAVCVTVMSLVSCGKDFRSAAMKHGFRTGMAITPGDLYDETSKKIIKSDCNILVYENNMKYGVLRPNKKFWNWSDIDLLIKFAQENKMAVKWHTLFWHQQNPPFLSSYWTREEALAEMDEHITTIMSRYKGIISEYDVVNEMFNEDGTMRETVWLKTIGPDYIEHALRKAHEIDPDAKLYLNEYSNEEKGHPKADAMYNFVKDLKERGVPIDGVGMQLHLDTTIPCSEEAIRANLERYKELGIDISFSEVDIRIPTGDNAAANEGRQQEMYEMLYRFAREMSNVKSVITWGISDKHSWVPSFYAGKGSALLYDNKLKPKPVYEAVFKEISK